ncbi:MAG: tRNA lysidine(34) synthetase TilS [Desulfomonilaceae bacterium]
MKRDESKKGLLTSVTDVIKRYRMIQRGDGVVVAISGGPDSTALMYILNILKGEMDFWMVPAHLDHRLRPESGMDAEFVREMSHKLSMEARIKSVNVRDLAAKRGISVEEAGRDARYAFFEEIRASSGARVVATAHHLDDVLETFFLRIFRGSSLKGLTGIAPARAGIVRPLIETSRAAILHFLEEEEIPYRIDPTNLDINCDRNFVRNRLIPKIEEHFPNFRNPLQRTIELLGEEEQFVKEMAQKLYSQTVSRTETGLELNVPALRSAPMVLASRAILLALYTISGPDVRWTRSHVETIWKLPRSQSPSAVAHLPEGLVAAREYDRLVLSKGAVAESKPQPVILVSGPGIVEIPGTGHILRLQLREREVMRLQEYDGITAVAFDADEVSFPLTVRSPRPGDRFRPWGLQGTRKLKKVLIDLKIPRDFRKQLPLLLKGDTILWIPGVRRSDAAPIRSATRRVLEVRIVKSSEPLPDNV